MTGSHEVRGSIPLGSTTQKTQGIDARVGSVSLHAPLRRIQSPCGLMSWPECDKGGL